MKKLNHWDRLKVVLTAIYVLIALIFSVYSYIDSDNPSPSDVKRTYFFAVYTPFEENEIVSYKQAKFEKCSKDGFFLEDLSGNKKRLSDDEWCRDIADTDLGQMAHKSPNYIGFTIVLIFIPMLFWLAVWSVVKITRWVLAGKANA